MKRLAMNLLRLLFALLMALPLSACALSGGPVSGKVLEEGTDKPITGAIVVVRWKGDLPSFADSKTVCYHVASTVSDEAGHYHIAAWRKEATADWQKRIINKEFIVEAYKVGYGFPKVPSLRDEIVYLAPFKGGSAERLEYLIRIISANNCPSAGSSSKNLYPMYKAMYEEANAISTTAEDRKMVDILRQEAAEVAVRPDGHITSEEMERKVNDFLRDNLR